MNRLLVHLNLLSVHNRKRTLECDLLSVAIHLLKQTTTGSERNVCDTPSGTFQRFADLNQHRVIDSITLNHTDLRRKLVVSFCVLGLSESLSKFLQECQIHKCGRTRIGSYHKCSLSTQDLFLECLTVLVRDCGPDVVRITHTCNQSFGVHVEHVLHSFGLIRSSPTGHGRMLRCGNGKSSDSLLETVEITNHTESRDRVRTCIVECVNSSMHFDHSLVNTYREIESNDRHLRYPLFPPNSHLGIQNREA